jgi:DNA polymerase I-like protein with 3'-5' exonuclease and polymerase domains
MFMISSGIEREGKNTPIQGSNADIAKEAMGLMWLDLEPKYGGELVNFVYDEFDLEAPTEHLKACMEFVGSCIERAGARYMKKVKMEWEGNISDKWSK